MDTKQQQEYQELASEHSKKSPIVKNCIMAFLTGGLICCVGQLFMTVFENLYLPKETVSSLTSVVMIFIGVFLTGIGVYEKIARAGGAGTLVPITGFANATVSPAMEFKSEGYVLGMAAKMFIIVGPVIVYGTVASVVYGIIYYLFLR